MIGPVRLSSPIWNTSHPKLCASTIFILQSNRLTKTLASYM